MKLLLSNLRRYDRRSARVPLSVPVCVIIIGCLIAGVGEKLTGTSAGSNVNPELTPGAVLSRDLAAGNNEVFEISLNANQLLRFSVDKGDLALVLGLYDPAGQKLIEQLSHSYEELEVSFPTDVPGRYRLQIRSLEREQSRPFQIKVDPIRAATTEDQTDKAARQAMARASFLRSDWTEKSLRQAVEKYDAAALIWVSSRNLRQAARASMAAGEVCLILGDHNEALERYQKASKAAKTMAARLEESAALSEAGRLYSDLGNNDEAQKKLAQGLDLLAADSGSNQPGSVKQVYARAISNLGEVSYAKGDLVQSSEHFKKALKLFQEVGDRDGEARVHLFIGYISGGAGGADKALAEISQALSLYRKAGDKSGEGLALTGLGLWHSLRREEEQAITINREALEIFRRIGDKHSEAITLNSLGQAYEYLGQYPTALENYRQALGLLQRRGAVDLASVSMFKIAGTYRLLGDLSQSLRYYNECLRLSRAAKKRRTEANALKEVALIYASRGSRSKTIRQYQKLLKFYDSIADRRGQAATLNDLGNFFLKLGEKKAALESYRQALPLSEQSGDRGDLVANLFNMARAERDLGALDDALLSIKNSIEMIEELRTNFASPAFRTSYFAILRKHYELNIDILMQLDRLRPAQGFDAAALLVSENARARSLIDILTEAGADIRQGAEPELLERERELRGLLASQARYQMDLSIEEKNSTEIDKVARQINLLRTQHQEIESRLRQQTPRLLSITKPAALSVEQIQAELAGGDTILLEYALGDERSYLWALTSNSLRSYELPARRVLENASREVYQSLTARQAIENIDASYQNRVEAADRLYDEKALDLSRMLLGPVADELGSKRLIVVSEGMLQYIPLGALPAPQSIRAKTDAAATLGESSADLTPLIERHEIITLPSFTTLVTIRQERQKATSSGKIVAVLADPVFTNDDDRVEKGRVKASIISAGLSQGSNPLAAREFEGRFRNGATGRLLHSSEEADAILAVAPRGTGMVARGFDASRETAMSSQVGEYKIVHFATHGFLNTEHPELSGIVLAMVRQNGSQTNGFMPLQDIYNLNLSADLVVLSACDTALGRDIKGEGLVSVTRGFMAAGSRSVVASLWKVDDRATTVLMEEFYKAMLQDGLPPAAALRVATLKIRQQKAWRAPYFWAGFVLQGEYKDRILVDSNSSPGLRLAVSVLLVLICCGLIVWHRRRRSRAVSS